MTDKNPEGESNHSNPSSAESTSPSRLKRARIDVFVGINPDEQEPSSTSRASDRQFALSNTLEEEVDQRVLAPDGYGQKSIVHCTLEDFESSLSEALDRLKVDSRRWVFIVEVGNAPHYYLQVLLREDGGLWSECVSNEYLSEEDKLTDAQCELLPTLGWQWPGPPATPNWHFTDEILNTGSAVGGLLLRTLRQVFLLDSPDRLSVTLFPVLSKD